MKKFSGKMFQVDSVNLSRSVFIPHSPMLVEKFEYLRVVVPWSLKDLSPLAVSKLTSIQWAAIMLEEVRDYGYKGAKLARYLHPYSWCLPNSQEGACIAQQLLIEKVL